MSVEKLGFPLPVKIEEDQKLFIDLDTEGNSPEDIVIEWHLEIRRVFGSYSADSGEIKLISIMKEYITAITERAIHFEDIVRLQDMVDNHIEHIYWFYKDSDICFSDMYLDYMEHILTFYVNLTLRVLLVLKKKIKVTQKKVNELTQKVIKRLSFYLLKSEYHIFHVLIRQTTTLVDGMIKDVMNILNSNICKQMFRNLYMHYLVMTPVRDMSDEAFCRAYILFENWKAFEDYKQNEKIEECVKNIYNRDVKSIGENEFLRKILMPQSSIMSELMKIMACDPSITKAYFEYIKSKQKGDAEIIDDVGKLALEDALLSDTELSDEDDFETQYMEMFDKLMGDAKYNLNDIVLGTAYCKDEDLSVPGEASVNGGVEILISDTDSDSDVEIVSIVPSLNSSKQVPHTNRRMRNTVGNTQPTTSFLESISIEVDTTRRKYGFRTLGNFDNSPSKKMTEANQSSTTDKTPVLNTTEDQDSDIEVIVEKPTEPCLIIDDDSSDNSKNKDPSPTETCTSESVSNMMQANSLEKPLSDTHSVASTPSGHPNSLVTNVSNNLSQIPMELIDDDSSDNSKNKDPSPTETCTSESVSNMMQANSLEKPLSDTHSVASTPSGHPNSLVTNVSNNLSQIPMELEILPSTSVSYVPPLEKSAVTAPSQIVAVSSPSDKIEEDTTPQAMQASLEIQEVQPAVKNSQVPIGIQTNEVVNHVCKCSQLPTSPRLTEKEHIQDSDKFSTISSTMQNVVVVQKNASIDGISKNDEVEAGHISENTSQKTVANDIEVALNQKVEEASITGDIEVALNQKVEEASITGDIRTSCNPVETDGDLVAGSKQTNEQSIPGECLNNLSSDEVELTGAVEYTEDISTESPIATKNCKTQQEHDAESVSLEIHLGALSITSESPLEHAAKPKNGFLIPSVPVNDRVNGALIKEEGCQLRDRTLKCNKELEVLKCRTEPQLDESTRCESGCGKDENTISHEENNQKVGYISSITDKRTNKQSAETTPLDTGQDPFVQPLDTGQFDANSPASPNEVNLKSSCEKSEVKMLRTVCEPVLRKGQHGEFGYPTPPGSEEERDKDSDEQTKLIYSNILPAQTFSVSDNIDPQDSEIKQVSQIAYEEPAPENVQKQDFLSEDVGVVDQDTSTTGTELIKRLSDKQTGEKGETSPNLGKSYEQIVKDAIGSQNSTEDEDDETQITSKKYNKDQGQDISFDEMEQFLKNCDNEDYPQSNRKKRKRTRDKTILEDNKSRKNSFLRSPKRVKINEKPETHFITTSYDEDSKDDVWEKQNSNNYDSSSSSENEDMDPNRPRVKAKRKPSPLPQSKYLSKRNGAVTHIPLSGHLSPDKPPPLKGILKRMEQKHTYHPLHPVDDEPETVVIVLHQRELRRGKRGSVEVKVYRKSFSAFQIPFDDHKLCHHAYVKLDRILTDDLDVWGKVSGRTRGFEEEIYNQPEKSMYKIVFDKKTPQLNSNDRKYFCDPSISSKSSASSKSKSTLFENEQGVRKKRTYVRKSARNEPDGAAKPSKRGRPAKNSSISKLASSPKKRKGVSSSLNQPPPVSNNLEETLSTYADFYRKEEEDALLEENFSNKARNLQRIIKRFEQAIKQHRLGKHVDVEKLPVPPGFPPFPEFELETKTTSTSEQSKIQDGRDSSCILKFYTKPEEYSILPGVQEIAEDNFHSSDYPKSESHSKFRKPKSKIIRKSSRFHQFPKYLGDFR